LEEALEKMLKTHLSDGQILQEIDTFFSTILSEQILEKSVMQIIS
jgi:hypothetical protein